MMLPPSAPLHSRRQLPKAALLLAVACLCQATALRPGCMRSPGFRGSQPHLASAHCMRSTLPRLEAAEETKEAARTKAQQDAHEKRMRAERLKLQAERAELEAEALALQAEQLKLAAELKRKASGKNKPAPADAQTADAQAPTDAPAVAETPAAEAVTPPVQQSVFGRDEKTTPTQAPFNLTELFPNNYQDINSSYNSVMQALAEAEAAVAEAEASLQLNATQIDLCKEKVFDMKSYFVTDVEQTALGTVFRGNLRKNPEETFDLVQSRLKAEEKLAGITLLLLQDPTPLTLEQLQAGEERRPVFLAVDKDEVSQTQTNPEKLIAVGSIVVTSFTTLGYALSSFLLSSPDGALIQQLANGEAGPEAAATIAFGVLGLQLLHEAAHLVQAKRLGIKTGIPVLVPSLQIGLFGGVTRILTFPRNRADLFDFALAGPAVAAVASLALFVAGLALSPTDAVTAATITPNPVLPVGLLHSSLLLGSIADVMLPTMNGAQNVELDPLAVIGFTGALINALNLLPIGRLDGGRISAALFGPTAGFISGLSLLTLGLTTILFGDNSVIAFFSFFIIFFQRSVEVPTANELSEVKDAGRLAAAAVAATFMLFTLLPYPAVEQTTQMLI